MKRCSDLFLIWRPYVGRGWGASELSLSRSWNTRVSSECAFLARECACHKKTASPQLVGDFTPSVRELRLFSLQRSHCCLCSAWCPWHAHLSTGSRANSHTRRCCSCTTVPNKKSLFLPHRACERGDLWMFPRLGTTKWSPCWTMPTGGSRSGRPGNVHRNMLRKGGVWHRYGYWSLSGRQRPTAFMNVTRCKAKPCWIYIAHTFSSRSLKSSAT